MTDAWFNRFTTRTLAVVFSAVLALLLVATGSSIVHMREQARLADDRAAVRIAAAARSEAAMALSRSRSDALRAALVAPTAPARLATERRLAALTRQWQEAIGMLRTPVESGAVADALAADELFAAAGRVLDAQADVLQALARNDPAGAQRIYVEREVEAESGLQVAINRLTTAHRVATASIAAESAERARRVFLLLAAAVALVIAGVGLAGHALIRRAGRQESDLHRERSLSDMTLRSINDGVITVDAEGRVEFMNAVAESLTGWRLDDARLRPLAEVYALVDERTREVHCFEPWQPSVTPQRRHEGESLLRLSSRDGREVSIRHSFSQVSDLEGTAGGAIIVFHDDSSLRTLAQQLSWQASHDALTGLANRREFERALTELLASAASGHKTHALLYIDLDHFKAVNDNGGHAAGDELLRQITTVMQSRMRASDLLSRLGGDEFGALLESCPSDQALRIANGLRDAVNEFVFVWQGRQFKVGATIGLLPIDAGSGSVAQVIAAADALCYQAKADGRDRIQVYRPDEEAGRRRSSDAQMISQISEAFELSRFVLYVQPVSPLRVELAGSAHREVLVRMLDANDNLVLPSAFLPAAERYELLTSIDRWALRALAVYLSERRARDDERGDRSERPMRHSLNVSSASLQDPEFRTFVRGLIESHRLPQGQLCLEVTEVGAMANLTRIADGMHELRAAGCSFALDDFGVGLSSFSYLRYLPIDYLKIEAGFVRDMIDDPMDGAIVDSIARIGHVLGIHTVAQGVDDTHTAGKLEAMGVDYAQGSQFGAPRPLLEGMARPAMAAPIPSMPLAPQALSLGGTGAGAGD
jgi:diguanylate cyclase (GGDEF)-like protein/PAS domain S-box-containing protein